MKKVMPFAFISVVLISFYGISSFTTAHGAPVKPVTQSQIKKLQNQIDGLQRNLEEAEETISFLQEQTRNSISADMVLSRHVWLTPAGLSTGCGAGAINVSTFNIPGTNSGFTGCVADILVKPIG